MENTMTTIDDALSEPWTVTRRYSRETGEVMWVEYVCMENNRHLRLHGDEWYFINSEEGTLDPTQRDQPRLVPESRAR